MNLKALIILLLACLFAQQISQSAVGDEAGMADPTNAPQATQTPPFLSEQDKWVDSVMERLSVDELIAQMILVEVPADMSNKAFTKLEAEVSQYQVGGVVFAPGKPAQQVQRTNKLQKVSSVPLFVAMDGRVGINSYIRYPDPLAIGAVRDHSLIYEMGKDIARQSRLMGVNFVFGPVMNVSAYPDNITSPMASYGDNKDNVMLSGYYLMKGIQDGRVLACAGPFPGLGAGTEEGRKGLKQLPGTREELDKVALYPYAKLIHGGLSGMQTAHVQLPDLDKRKHSSGSLSKQLVYDILRVEQNFQGLIVSDTLRHPDVIQFAAPGELDYQAFLAGNDLLLFPENVSLAIRSIRGALLKRKVPIEVLEWKVKKILKAKYWAGLNNRKPIRWESLETEIKTPKAQLVNQKLAEAALTLLKNDQNLLPIGDLDQLKIASIALGVGDLSPFQQQLSVYAPIDHFTISPAANQQQLDITTAQLRDYNLIIAGINLQGDTANNYGMTQAIYDWIANIGQQKHTIIALFGNTYGVRLFETAPTLAVAHHDLPEGQSMMAQAIFGGTKMRGRMPVTVSEKVKAGDGMLQNKITRFKYTYPEEVGMSSRYLEKVDSIAWRAIYDKATPGCQILVAKEGKVILQRSYGNHTYDGLHPVKNSDLYDLASITKIAGSMLCLMQLYDQQKFNIDRTLSDYLPALASTNKSDLVIKDVLVHQSRLRDWIPFYVHTLTKEGVCDEHYCTEPNEWYSHQVADSLFIQNTYADTMWMKIASSKLRKKTEYKYSDIGFYIFQAMIEGSVQMPMNEYLDNQFYRSLGLNTMCYRPLERFSKDDIVPTEDDTYFRHRLVHGTVHDPGSAMMGGVAGHAGLFSNSNDLAVIMQLLLNEGTYGGKRYLEASTIKKFTSKQLEDNRRGLGFDKPEPDPNKISPASDSVSLATFGHTGFTGTCTWADPENQLIYVFLSNRVHPDANNRDLIRQNVRTNIQDVLYQAVALGLPKESPIEINKKSADVVEVKPD